MTTTKDLLLSLWKCTSIPRITEHADHVVHVNYLLKYSSWFLLLIFFSHNFEDEIWDNETHQDGWVSISRLEAISGYSTDHRTHKSQANNHMSARLCT